MDLSTARQGHEGSVSGGVGDVCPLYPEYHCLVNRQLVDTGDISGSGETFGGAGVNDMVGIEHTETGAGSVSDIDRGVVERGVRRRGEGGRREEWGRGGGRS